MKILFAVTGSGMGGHTKSAAATAKALKALGVHPLFLLGPGMSARFLAGFDVPCYSLNLFQRDLVLNIKSRILSIIQDVGECSVLHFFGSPEAAIPYAQAAQACDLRFCLTIPGGKPPASFCGFRDVVAFTREVSDQLIERENVNLAVMPARLERKAEFHSERARAKFRPIINQYLECTNDTIVLGRIARCSTEYIGEIVSTAKEVALLNKQGINIKYCHIGFAHSLRVARRIQKELKKLNESGLVACSIQKKIPDVWQYSSAFDLQVAAGRSALEAMEVGTPLIQYLGDGRFVGMDASTVPTLAAVNFSSRASSQLLDKSDPLGSIVKQMQDARKLQEVSDTYSAIVETYDSKNAAYFYQTYYESCKIPSFSRYSEQSVLRRSGKDIARDISFKLRDLFV